MNKRVLLLLIICLFTLSLPSLVNHNLYDELMIKYQKIETYQADLEQVSYYSEIDYTNEARGSIKISNDSILIDYQYPKLEKIVFSDNIVKIYQTESDRLIITQADSSLVTLDMKYLLKRIWKNEKMDITSDNNYYHVKTELSAENAISNISKLAFKIDKKSMLVTQLYYSDDAENTVTISFSNIKLNEEISPQLWKIDTSDNTIIIDYRE